MECYGLSFASNMYTMRDRSVGKKQQQQRKHSQMFRNKKSNVKCTMCTVYVCMRCKQTDEQTNEHTTKRNTTESNKPNYNTVNSRRVNEEKMIVFAQYIRCVICRLPFVHFSDQDLQFIRIYEYTLCVTVGELSFVVLTVLQYAK